MWQSAEIDALKEICSDLKQLLAGCLPRTLASGKVWKLKNSQAIVWGMGSIWHATMFSGTATVESDFLLINGEENDFCSNLTDFSIEGILYSKQYFELLGVASNMNA